MNPNSVITRTGIRIGAAYTMPPPTEIGSEAEAIQAALLRRPSLIQTKTPWWGHLLNFFRRMS